MKSSNKSKSRTFCSQRSFRLNHCSHKVLTQPQQAAGSPKKVRDKAVFLDRDGTINFDKGYTHKIEDFKFLPRAIQGLKKLSQSKYRIIITTNQAGIARKYYKKSDVEKLHCWLLAILRKNKVWIDKIYYCSHHPDDNCKCRKPKTGMFLRAGRELKIKLTGSWVIGDDNKDIAAGEKIKARTIKIGNKKSKEIKIKPRYRAANLLEAARIILSREQKNG